MEKRCIQEYGELHIQSKCRDFIFVLVNNTYPKYYSDVQWAKAVSYNQKCKLYTNDIDKNKSSISADQAVVIITMSTAVSNKKYPVLVKIISSGIFTRVLAAFEKFFKKISN